MKKTLSVVDATALIVGIVVGVGIFKTPSIVAAYTGSSGIFIGVWALGGLISLMGASCYAELASTHPHPGGEYHYLGLALGRHVAFLFAWARMMVIQTGSIAMLAFVLGDYLSQVVPLGTHSSSLYGSLSVIVLTAINMIGIREGKCVQNLLTGVKVAGLLLIVLTGLLFSDPQPTGLSSVSSSAPAFGLSMIFVLLTYGGWNEAAYISAELRDLRRNMVRSLLWGIILITIIYILINWVYVRVLGITFMGKSDAVAYDLMNRIVGPYGAKLAGILIAISALGAMNATVITGARTNYALGETSAGFRYMGRWNERTGSPVYALGVQGIIALLLIGLGTVTMKGFVTMVEYTAPVFWLFFLLTTLSLLVLRVKEPTIVRPFRVPLYPFTPIFFCVVCMFMLVSSILYTGIGALVGIAVLVAGSLFLLVSTHKDAREE